MYYNKKYFMIFSFILMLCKSCVVFADNTDEAIINNCVKIDDHSVELWNKKKSSSSYYEYYIEEFHNRARAISPFFLLFIVSYAAEITREIVEDNDVSATMINLLVLDIICSTVNIFYIIKKKSTFSPMIAFPVLIDIILPVYFYIIFNPIFTDNNLFLHIIKKAFHLIFIFGSTFCYRISERHNTFELFNGIEASVHEAELLNLMDQSVKSSGDVMVYSKYLHQKTTNTPVHNFLSWFNSQHNSKIPLYYNFHLANNAYLTSISKENKANVNTVKFPNYQLKAHLLKTHKKLDLQIIENLFKQDGMIVLEAIDPASDNSQNKNSIKYFNKYKFNSIAIIKYEAFCYLIINIPVNSSFNEKDMLVKNIIRHTFKAGIGLSMYHTIVMEVFNYDVKKLAISLQNLFNNINEKIGVYKFLHLCV